MGGGESPKCPRIMGLVRGSRRKSGWGGLAPGFWSPQHRTGGPDPSDLSRVRLEPTGSLGGQGTQGPPEMR